MPSVEPPSRPGKSPPGLHSNYARRRPVRVGATSTDVSRPYQVSSPPLRRHTEQADSFYILKGTLRVQVGDEFHGAAPTQSQLTELKEKYGAEMIGPTLRETMGLV